MKTEPAEERCETQGVAEGRLGAGEGYRQRAHGPREGSPGTPQAGGGGRRPVDILAELEKIRQQTLGAAQQPVASQPPAANGYKEIEHRVSLSLPRASFSRARHFLISLRLEDESHQVVDSYQEGIELEDLAQLDQLLLNLKIALQPRE